MAASRGPLKQRDCLGWKTGDGFQSRLSRRIIPRASVGKARLPSTIHMSHDDDVDYDDEDDEDDVKDPHGVPSEPPERSRCGSAAALEFDVKTKTAFGKSAKKVRAHARAPARRARLCPPFSHSPSSRAPISLTPSPAPGVHSFSWT